MGGKVQSTLGAGWTFPGLMKRVYFKTVTVVGLGKRMAKLTHLSPKAISGSEASPDTTLLRSEQLTKQEQSTNAKSPQSSS